MEKYYWLNKHSRQFLQQGYLKEGVSPEQRIREIAENAEKILRIEGFADKFENYVALGYYSLSTPVWTNFGNDRGLPVSCFSSYLSDNLQSILGKVAEVGLMSKYGGGTSGFFGDLRPRGAKISVGGESSGPVHFMELFDTVADVISQGSARRGSFAAYLPVEHPDVEEFLQIRSEGNSIQNMSIGVTISDEWMQEMVDGDSSKRKLWGKIIQKRFQTGYPYIQFSDTVNNNAPQVYKDNGMKIKSSNLCVSGETQILTREGFREIKQYENQKVEVWNGEEWSWAECAKTGENKELIHVFVENLFEGGSEVNSVWVTENHKFYLLNGTQIEAQDLQEGDQLETPNYKKGEMPHYEAEILYSSVLCISKKEKVADTYCVNEPKRHKVVFNGILTGQCSEIELFSDDKNSFVCVLSSINLLHWDEIIKTDAIETLIHFLDSVNEEFIQKTNGMKFMEAPNNFAKSQRALGAGVLGWHSLLQSKMIPFESMEAKLLNSKIWKTIRERADSATEYLASLLGEPELLKGYGRRNVTTLACAPTTSSSFILGQVSPSIEPENSNYYVKKLAKGSFTYKNPYLKNLLKKYEKNTDEVWESILIKGGSVQHLDFLAEEEKDIFKTFGQISQKEIVIQASQRQKYIDQSQSLNLMVPAKTKPKEASDLLIEGWRLGVKTFYYQKSTNPVQELSRSLGECVSCGA